MSYALAIDPGTKCGWAIYRYGTAHELIASGTWDLSPRRHEGGGMRFVRLDCYLRELFEAYPVTLCFYEEVRRHLGTDAGHIYGGIVAHLTAACEAATPKIAYKGIPVATIKKHATGKGNADKEAMISASRATWPTFAGDDNEADARWIGLAGLHSLNL